MSKRRRKARKTGNVPAKEVYAPQKQSQDHPKTKRWEKLVGTINLTASLATIFAIGATIYQIAVGNWQFDRSGPDYTWFMLDDLQANMEFSQDNRKMSTQTTFAMVMSNSGRTEDTVISLSRNTRKTETMRMCIPEFDEEGEYKTDSAVLDNKGSLALAPGEARLLFMVSPRSEAKETAGTIGFRSDSFEITGDLTVYSASGRTWKAKRMQPDQEVIDHYGNLPGIERAKKDCMGLVNEKTE